MFLLSLIINVVLISGYLYQRHNLSKLLQCPTYGCLTRQAIEIQWQRLQRKHGQYDIVFLDLDNMHRLNEEHGHAAIDQKIKNSLSQFRQCELLGRWYSGDEIVVIVPSDESLLMSKRMRSVFRSNGLSATFGIHPCHSKELKINAECAMSLVENAKLLSQRGTINY